MLSVFFVKKLAKKDSVSPLIACIAISSLIALLLFCFSELKIARSPVFCTRFFFYIYPINFKRNDKKEGCSYSR